jgi:hypothetical protein
MKSVTGRYTQSHARPVISEPSASATGRVRQKFVSEARDLYMDHEDAAGVG